MNSIFYKLPQTIARIFSGKNLLWHVVMIALTAVLVLSGFDWWYFSHTEGTIIQTIGFSAALVGFFVPVFVPIGMYIASVIKKSTYLRTAANAIVQAGLLGLGISSLYKVFTGRTGLPHGIIADTSEMFRFGFYRGGAFQGWPSSHTSVAFARSMALICTYPKNKLVRVVALAYALYIGLGVSVSIHWFSDFAAGIVLGSIIGITVGKQYFEKISLKKAK